MMLNVFKSTMSNFLPPPLNGQLGWKPAFSLFFSNTSLFPYFTCWRGTCETTTNTSGHVPYQKHCYIAETVHLRLQEFLWHESNQALISHHPVPTCCVCSLLRNTVFAFHKCESSELSFHLGVYESRRFLRSLLNTQRRLSTCMAWRMPSGSFTFLKFLKGPSACDRVKTSLWGAAKTREQRRKNTEKGLL